MQGRGSYRLDPATSIQEQKYSVYRPLPVLKNRFCWLPQIHFSISFSEEIVGLFDYHYIRRRSILAEIHLEKYKKLDIKNFGLVPCFTTKSEPFERLPSGTKKGYIVINRTTPYFGTYRNIQRDRKLFYRALTNT